MSSKEFLKIDVKDLVRLSKDIGDLDKVTETALFRGLSSSTGACRKLAREEIKKRVNLQSSYINKYLKIIPPRKHLNFFILRGNYRATLLSRFEPMPSPSAASRFRVGYDNSKYRKKGKSKRARTPISVIVKSKQAGGVRKPFPGAFYMKLRDSDSIGIAWKRYKYNKGKRGGKYEVFHGPSTHQVLGQIKDDITPHLAEVVDRKVKGALERGLRQWTQRR